VVDRSQRRSKPAKAQDAKRPQPDEPCRDEQLLRALIHRLRRQILRLVHASPEPLSPCQIERALDLPRDNGRSLSGVSYHMRALADLEVLSLVNTQLVRGATEHFYASEVSDVGWLRGVLSRTQQSDEAQLWPRGRKRPGTTARGAGKR
jgi:DNA-binding transcriptional ArsR family regulator